jgi:hypothetical protein
MAVGCDPNHLMAAMGFETGRTFSPSVRNPKSSAVGLIQFMTGPRSWAVAHGYTRERLEQMTPEEQLGVVAEYLAPYKGRLNTLSDVYMAILWPAAVGLPEDHVMWDADDPEYFANRGLDVDADGKVTKAEAAGKVQRVLDEGLQPGNVFDDDAAAQAAPKEGRMGIALPLLAQLIPQVLGQFSGRAQATIAEKTGADPKVAADFMQALIAQVGHAVGVPVVSDATATQAVGAFTAAPPEDRAAKAAALEKQALATLDALLKSGDKMAEWDAAMWAARIAGRASASSVAIAEKAAGLWDMTPFLVKSLLIMLWGIAWGLLGAIIYLIIDRETPDPVVLTALFSMAGPIWTGAIVASVVAIVAYRFDGTKESTEQSKAVADAIRQRGGQQ